MSYAEKLPYLLKNLRMPAVAANWQEIANEAQSMSLSYGDYLAKLLDLELILKQQNRLNRAYKQSKLPPAKTMANFSFAESKIINQEQITQLAADPDWVNKTENLILMGPSGIGKTHLACAIAYGLLQTGIKVLFSNTTLLVQSLQLAKVELRLNKELERLSRFKLLVLDDIGYVRKSEQETSVLFELISNRYETGSMIITANQPFSQWGELFPDQVMAVAAIDRLIHHATIINIKGDSYRAKQAKQRTDKKGGNKG